MHDSSRPRPIAPAAAVALLASACLVTGCGATGAAPEAPEAAARLACGDGRCSETESASRCPRDCLGVEWVALDGGAFTMGSEAGPASERPRHQVTLEGFELMKREATTAEYRACVRGGACTEPRFGADPELTPVETCTWLVEGREDHPMNCITWSQARDFCRWVDGRLPSEAEWEYAARSGGREVAYPWGDTVPTCAYAVMGVEPFYVGCREERTWPVCSKPQGNSDQGLCDMAGNVMEWVEDQGHRSYSGAPGDGSAWVASPDPETRVARGGSLATRDPAYLRTTVRFLFDPDQPRYVLGVRCAR